MTKRELQERKKALRRSLAEQRARARAAVAQNPMVQRARRKRTLRRGAGLAALLLVLLFVRCECDPPPEPPPPEPVTADAGTPEVKAPAPAKKPQRKPPPLQGNLDGRARAQFDNDGKAPPTWLEEFRIQVAARSVRLSECFNGTARPGALRWSAAVNAASGSVSDHALEPVGASELTKVQRDCVVGVLSSPVYKLAGAQPQDLPNRVGLVIEF